MSRAKLRAQPPSTPTVLLSRLIQLEPWLSSASECGLGYPMKRAIDECERLRRDAKAAAENVRRELKAIRERERRQRRAPTAATSQAAALVRDAAIGDDAAVATTEFWRQAPRRGLDVDATLRTGAWNPTRAIPSMVPSADARPWAIRRAASFYRERSLARWVLSMNTAAGLAPTTAHVWNIWTSGVDATFMSDAVLSQRSVQSTRRARQWVRRWRRRWGLRRARPLPGPGLSPDELRAKAPPLCGTISGHRFRTLTQTRAPKAGPEQSPKNGTTC